MSSVLPDGFLPGGHLPAGHIPEGDGSTPPPAATSVVGLIAAVAPRDALAASVSLRYVAGDSVALEFSVVDEAGEPANISGDTIEFAIADHSGALISTEDESAVAAITDEAGGIFTVSIAADDTAALLGTYRFQARLTDIEGNVATVSRGFITFRAGALSISPS